MRKRLNEKGNVTLFVLGLFGILMIMFIFLFNLSKIYAVKEQAATTSQQASLAATAEFYERVWNLVGDFEEIDEENMPPPEEGEEKPGNVGVIPKIMINFKVSEREKELASKYPEKSRNEVHIQAIDDVLSEELRSGLGKKRLKRIITENYEASIKPAMITKAKDVIRANGGKVDGGKIYLFDDNRIFVKAANEFEGQGSMFTDLKEKVFQTSAGPTIDFLPYLDGITDETINLSKEQSEELIWEQ